MRSYARNAQDGVAGPFEFLSYGETGARVAHVAAALAALGLKRGDRVGIYGQNSAEWMIALQVRRGQVSAAPRGRARAQILRSRNRAAAPLSTPARAATPAPGR